MKAAFVLSERAYNVIYPPALRQEIARVVEVVGDRVQKEAILADPGPYEEVEIVLSGWGGPHVDDAFIEAMPNLKLVLYGAGSIRGIVSETFWDHGLRITSSWGANAVPVAEFALGHILICLKRGYQLARMCRQARTFKRIPEEQIPGAYGSTVGLVSLGMIGRLLVERLRQFDVKPMAYDPYIAAADAAELGVELVGLEELFARADVVSLHTPNLPETQKLITPELLRAMPEYGCFINTARGAVVDEAGLIEVLRERPDLQAVLDVTYPEPPPAESPLYDLPNVLLTPHIAGSLGAECERMGRYVLADLRHYLAGEPLEWEIDRERAKRLA